MSGGTWGVGDVITAIRMNTKTLYVGTAAPGTIIPGMLWFDTDVDKLYERNAADDVWIEHVTVSLASTITGLLTFNRGAAVPFAVDAASLKVTNLDADLLDGQHRAITINADHTHQSTGAQGGKLDHGLALDGLGDDDHTIYQLVTAARAFTGDLLPDATNTRKLGNSTGPKVWSEVHGTNFYGSVRYADMRFLDLACVNCGERFRVGDSLKLVVKGFEEDAVTGLEMLAVPVHMRCRRQRRRAG